MVYSVCANGVSAVGSYVASGLTGDGHVELAGTAISPTELLITMTNYGSASVLWQQPSNGAAIHGLTRVTHAGLVALGYPASGTDDSDIAAWWTFIEFSYMDLPVVLPPAWVKWFFWHLQPGVEIHVEINW